MARRPKKPQKMILQLGKKGRRPRLRHRQPGLLARHRLRAAARDVREADRRAPGGALPPRRDGDQGTPERPPRYDRGRWLLPPGARQRQGHHRELLGLDV